MTRELHSEPDARRAFTYVALPARVIFGEGVIKRLPEEVERLGCRRALLLSTPTQRKLAEQGMALLGANSSGIFDGARMHVPVDVVEAATRFANEVGADGLVAIGGGSTIGLAKALALRLGIPIVAAPTTYSGSEMTPIYGITEGAIKRTGRDPVVAPRVVLYDPALSLGLPIGLSVVSAFNAIAHACEGLYARDRNPVTSLMAEEGIRAIVAGLRALADTPEEGRSDCLYGAWLCGTVLGAVGMALHHKLCHTLGGTFGLPHAEAHAIILPHVLAYNARYAPFAMAAISRALGGGDAPVALYTAARDLGAPLALRDIGMPQAQLEEVVRLTMTDSYWNPRPLEAGALLALLNNAWAGHAPH